MLLVIKIDSAVVSRQTNPTPLHVLSELSFDRPLGKQTAGTDSVNNIPTPECLARGLG
jgi:hypothetical protein